MSFYLKYELLRLVRESVAKTFLATEKSTRREVYLHLIEGRNVELVDRLKRLRSRSDSPAALQIIDIGEFAGSYYVATEVLEGFDGLDKWAEAALAGDSASGGSRSDFETPPAKPPPAAAERAPLGEARLVGRLERDHSSEKPADDPRNTRERFDDLFGGKAKKTPATSAPPPAAEKPQNKPQDKDKKEPGEFTRLFGAGGNAGETTAPAPPPAAAPAPPPATPPPSSPSQPAAEPPADRKEPGEFTRLFGAGASSPAEDPPARKSVGRTEAPPPAPAPAAPPPASPPVNAPPPAEPRPAAEAQKEPGEFTRLFGQKPETPPPTPRPTPQSSTAGSKPAPSSDSQGPGEFTRLFGEKPETPPPTPRPTPPRAAADPQPAAPERPAAQDSRPATKAGEFTQMFGATSAPSDTPEFTGASARERTPRPPAEPTPASQPRFEPLEITPQPSSSATVSPPKTPPPAAQPSAGEFTRLFGKNASPSAEEAPAGGARRRREDDADRDEFSEMFGSGLVRDADPEPFEDDEPVDPNPKSKPFKKPGEFTQMFGRFDGEPVETRHDYEPAPDGDLASGLFRSPSRSSGSSGATTDAETGMGEYTQLVRGDSVVEKPAGGGAAAPADDSSDEAAEPPPKTNKWILIALAVAVVIAGLAIGVAAYLFMNREAPVEPADQPAVEQPAEPPAGQQ